MSDKEVFVSRRGRKTTLDQDLEIINIEDPTPEQPVAPPAPSKPPKEPKPPKPAKPRREFKRPSFSSKRTKIVAAIIVAIVLVPLFAAELLALQYRSEAEQIQTETVRIGQEVALPKQKEKKYREALDQSAAELSALQQRSCKGGLLDNAATLYPRAKSAHADCNEANQQLAGLVNALKILQQADDYTVKAQAILKTPLAPSSEAFAVIPDQISAWQTAATKTDELKAPASLSSFHTALTQAVESMADGWSELNVANNAQDQAGFDAAEKKLTENYQTLRSLSGELSTQLQDLQSTINSTYKTTQSS